MVKFALFALTSMLPCLGGVLLAAEKSKDAPKQAATEKISEEQLLNKDRLEIQGIWSRSERSGLFGSRRITKEIHGDRETVTYYDSDGNVESADNVKFTLRRAGPIRIFSFSEQEFTAGPQKGQKSNATVEYVYKIVGDKFVEIWGVLSPTDDELKVMRWTHEGSAAAH